MGRLRYLKGLGKAWEPHGIHECDFRELAILKRLSKFTIGHKLVSERAVNTLAVDNYVAVVLFDESYLNVEASAK